MSLRRKHDDLLIDFNNLSVDDQSSDVIRKETCLIRSLTTEEHNESSNGTVESMAFLCSSQPLYKLLNSESNIDDNNPFDHLDKQACLSDDPFEIVENAALNSSDVFDQVEKNVETGTLISIESPVFNKNEHSKTACDTPKKSGSQNQTKCLNSVKNTSQKQELNSKSVSPSGKIRSSKTKNASLCLLKYSLSNSRLDLVAETGANSEEGLSTDEKQPKVQKMGTPIRRESASTDDSFDDIWSTKPNLIDSQTDIEIESDIDIDIAKLNIPMLNISISESNLDGDTNTSSKRGGQIFNESSEIKLSNRSEILEKLASIKQKIPQSPNIPVDTSTVQINQTADINLSQLHNNIEDPVTPKSQFSSVLLTEKLLSDNPNSLIENLKKLVDQYDDKSKQTTAKHLLDDLSSILTKTTENTNDDRNKDHTEIRPPQFIKRQGTFSIEKENDPVTEKNQLSDVDGSKSIDNIKKETSPTESGHSEVVKLIQNALGVHQNINVLQTNVQSADAINPTYIVVMAQSVNDFAEKEGFQRPRRSQSLSLKEKPLAAIRAAQQKSEQSQATRVLTTPVKRPALLRRSSIGAITRTTPKNENEVQNMACIPLAKPNAPNVIRRRSLQVPAASKQSNAPESIPTLNPVTRRRSFQGASTTSGIRPPSPIANPNMIRTQTGPIRLNCNTTGTLTRRKSFTNDTAKDSPQKIKSSYGIMKKPSAPPAARNLKIRVSQTVTGRRSTAPLRAVMPMNRVASLLLINETVSPVDENRSAALITSTPRSIPVSSPLKYKKGRVQSAIIHIIMQLIVIFFELFVLRVFNGTISRVSYSKFE